MLHPLPEGESCNQIIPEVQKTDSVMTLHFNFAKEPTDEQIETLGLGLNKSFEGDSFRVNEVRWGGMQTRGDYLVHKWIDGVNEVVRRKKSNFGRVQDPVDDGVASLERNPTSNGILTPSSAKLEPLELHRFFAEGEIVSDQSECGQERRKRRRLSH